MIQIRSQFIGTYNAECFIISVIIDIQKNWTENCKIYYDNDQTDSSSFELQRGFFFLKGVVLKF